MTLEALTFKTMCWQIHTEVGEVMSMRAVRGAFRGKGQRTCCSGHIPFDLDSDESAAM